MPTTRRPAAPKPAAKAARKAPPKAAARAATSGLRILRKYPNRRLYDTAVSRYVTLAEVKAMVLANVAFEVRDATSGDDLTRAILLQIILEEETGGMPIFSTTMLSQIIRFYGHAMQGMMGSYLEKNLQTFTDIQGRLGMPAADAAGPASDLWSQYLKGQAPMVQNVMGNMLEQSRSMFVQMQDQMAKQAGTMFPALTPLSDAAPSAPKAKAGRKA